MSRRASGGVLVFVLCRGKKLIGGRIVNNWQGITDSNQVHANKHKLHGGKVFFAEAVLKRMPIAILTPDFDLRGRKNEVSPGVCDLLEI